VVCPVFLLFFFLGVFFQGFINGQRSTVSHIQTAGPKYQFKMKPKINASGIAYMPSTLGHSITAVTPAAVNRAEPDLPFPETTPHLVGGAWRGVEAFSPRRRERRHLLPDSPMSEARALSQRRS
jgi:hypothetical protein